MQQLRSTLNTALLQQLLHCCIMCDVQLSSQQQAQLLDTPRAVSFCRLQQQLLHNTAAELTCSWQLAQLLYAGLVALLHGRLQQLLYSVAAEVVCC